MIKPMLSLAALLLLSNCSLLTGPHSSSQAPVVLLGHEVELCLHGTVQGDGEVAEPYSLAVRLDADTNPGTLVIHRVEATFSDGRRSLLVPEQSPLSLFATEVTKDQTTRWVIDHFFTDSLRLQPESTGGSLSVVIDASIVTTEGSARDEFVRVWELGEAQDVE